MRVRLIRTGTTPIPPGYLFRGEARNPLAPLGIGVPGDAMVQAPIGAFLIEHPAEGPLLVDNGVIVPRSARGAVMPVMMSRCGSY